MVQMALGDLFGAGISNLIVTQSEMPKARLAWFEKPTDPKQLWTEHRIEGSLDLNQPCSPLVADFNAHGRADILHAARARGGRLIVVSTERYGRLHPCGVGRT